MAQLAIKGHETHGKEVIELLKMLGGNNPHEYVADSDCFGFFIGNETRNIYYDWLYNFDGRDVTIFTLEEFLEKFPYKVGDKVKNARINDFVGKIINVRWDDNENQIIYTVEWDDVTKTILPYYTRGLQPYKEEIMEKQISPYMDCDVSTLKGWKQFVTEVITKTQLKYFDIPKKGYKFAGVDNDNQQVVFEKISYHYPKTCKKCCEVLGIEEDLWFVYEDIDDNHINPACISNYRIRNLDLYHNFEKLRICRDAYWKLAGEQLGLGKPWEPDWLGTNTQKYCIYYVGNEIKKQPMLEVHHFLAFPTAEMRDIFYEYFKDLIEQCKELL